MITSSTFTTTLAAVEHLLALEKPTSVAIKYFLHQLPVYLCLLSRAKKHTTSDGSLQVSVCKWRCPKQEPDGVGFNLSRVSALETLKTVNKLLFAYHFIAWKLSPSVSHLMINPRDHSVNDQSNKQIHHDNIGQVAGHMAPPGGATSASLADQAAIAKHAISKSTFHSQLKDLSQEVIVDLSFFLGSLHGRGAESS